MAVSKTQIANKALIYLGVKTITSIADAPKSAVVLNAIIDQCIEEVLRAHPWNSATFRSQPGPDATGPLYDWTNQFSWPLDCLRILKIDDGRTKYKIENKKILTNSDTIDLLYIKKILPGEMDSLLSDTVSARMAWDAAMSLTDDIDTESRMERKYGLKLSEARNIDAQESAETDDLGSDEWVDTR